MGFRLKPYGPVRTMVVVGRLPGTGVPEEVRSKHQKDFQCEQARQAISLYYATLTQAFPGE
jgi:hypothetical protein